MVFFRKFTFYALFSLMILLLTPKLSFAEAEPGINNSSEAIEVLQETELSSEANTGVQLTVEINNSEVQNGVQVEKEEQTTTENGAQLISTQEGPQKVQISTNEQETSIDQSVTVQEFTLSDQYFEVVEETVAIYDNSGGSLKYVGYLNKGQVFPRVADYGDWHQIKYGNGYGYVWKGSTVPAKDSTIKNLNISLRNTSSYFIPTETLAVYDNTSGVLVPFASLTKGIQYPYISDNGDWYQVDVSGRIGYVYKPATKSPFITSDRYFKVIENGVSIYDNSSGALKHVGYLNKDQVYPRIADYGDWHQIKYGNGYGYVWKESTAPVKNYPNNNLNLGLPNTNRSFTTTDIVTVYDNSSGQLVPFASLSKDIQYPFISEMGDWYQVDISGRIGYVYKPATKLSFISTDKYFQVEEEIVAVYDNSTGKLEHVGYILKGQVYPRISDYGDWHQIQYGNGYGYVWKAATKPVTSPNLKNINTGLKNTSSMFKATDTLTVYDNTSGQLVPFAKIFKDVKYPIINEYGDWYQIEISGRIGYVYKPATQLEFNAADKFFQALDRVSVYENQNGALVHVGYLLKDQVYPRTADYGDWHQIKYGRGYGYVWKDATRPVNGNTLKNISNLLVQGENNFKAITDLTVYDNTSGSLVPYGTINSGIIYPFIDVLGDWVKIDFSGRVGYVYRNALQIGPIMIYTNYDMSFQDAVNVQVSLKNPVPQTDKKYRTYIRQDALIVDNLNNPTTGTVNGVGWKVRGGPSQQYWVVGTLNDGEKVTILSKFWNPEDNYWWYEFKYNRTWVNASPEDVKYYMDYNNVIRGSKEDFQFLRLSGSAGTNVDEINAKVLLNKGILSNKAQAFYEASKENNVNEVYLIAHSLLETGNGTSALANGILVDTIYDSESKTYVKVEPKIVYNMYGINAKDGCPNTCGAEYAYKQGWDTPEKAIKGGAQWIANKYINNKQDTLYEMRWNPANPGTNQYASDIGWAYKQVNNIKKIYDLLDSYILTFDFPVYRQ